MMNAEVIAKCLFLLMLVVGGGGSQIRHYEQQLMESVDEQALCDDPEVCEVRNWNLSLHRYRNTTGDWVDLSLTGDDWGRSAADSNMGVKATVFECQGRKMIRLHATIKDPIFFPKSLEPLDDRIKFHKITGENIVLTNNEHTAMKKDITQHGVVFSSRPLKPNEMFEVMIDQAVVSKKYANAIGVTTLVPVEGEVPFHMNAVKSGTWMIYHTQIWHNGSRIRKRLVKYNIDKLKVGDRLGVMTTAEGALHVFINGADQGPAATGIPGNVYGVFELYGDTSQVTIAQPS